MTLSPTESFGSPYPDPDRHLPSNREHSDSPLNSCASREADVAELLREEALEQVMRLTCDETLLYPLLDPIPPARAAVVVGRILNTLNVRPRKGCPLLALGAGTGLDNGWRRHYPPAERSLYSELLFCRELAGLAHGDEDSVDFDAFAELEHLRERVGFPGM